MRDAPERAPLMHPGPLSDGQFYSPPESVAGDYLKWMPVYIEIDSELDLPKIFLWLVFQGKIPRICGPLSLFYCAFCMIHVQLKS